MQYITHYNWPVSDIVFTLVCLYCFCFHFANVINRVVEFFCLADDCEIHETTTVVLYFFSHNYLLLSYIISKKIVAKFDWSFSNCHLEVGNSN